MRVLLTVCLVVWDSTYSLYFGLLIAQANHDEEVIRMPNDRNTMGRRSDVRALALKCVYIEVSDSSRSGAR